MMLDKLSTADEAQSYDMIKRIMNGIPEHSPQVVKVPRKTWIYHWLIG